MAQTTSSKGFSVAALVLGIVGIVGAWIPFLNWVSVILGILALIFGIIAVKTKRDGKGQALAGLILGAITIAIFLIITIVIGVIMGSAINQAADTNWSTLNDSYQFTIE
jgi:hypothetical protein